MATYTVKKGDNLWDIGKKYGVNWQDLKSWNNISNHYTIPIGTTLRLNAPAPAAPKAPAPAPAKPVAAAPAAPAAPSFIKETANAGFAANPVQLPYQGTDLNSILKQSQDMLAPLLQTQKDAATSTMGSQMQKLSDQWASRGLLASGIASTQQSQAAQALAGQMAQIEAQGQATALDNAYQLGNFQEEQRQFDLGYALEEANVTGEYLPAGTRQLVNQLAAQKQIVENPNSTKDQRLAASQQANSIRAALSQMGVDSSSLGSNASLQDLLNTMSSGRLGTPTQAAQEFTQNLGWQKESFDREMDLRESSEAFDREMETRIQNFEEQRAKVEQELQRQGLDLDRARVNLQELATMNDIERQQHLQNMEIDQESARRATSKAIAEAQKFGSNDLDKAYKWIYSNADNFWASGVDVNAVMSALSQRFGGSATANPFQ